MSLLALRLRQALRAVAPRATWVLAAVLLGCTDRLPESLGPNNEILVLADPDDWRVLEAPLRETFEKVLRTPQEEVIFSLKRGDIAHFEQHKHKWRKSLLVVAPLDAPHESSGFLRSLLSQKVQDAIRGGRGGVSWKRDVWAKGQVLMTVTGQDLEAVVENIRTEADRLYREVDAARNDRVRKLIFRYGERQDVSGQLAQDYGWSVRVPFGYRILEAYPDSGYVVLVKQEPNRWLWVYWEDGVSPVQLTPDWCIEKRDEITRRFFDGDRVADGQPQIEQTEFAGKLAYSISGLWENERTWSGGPFKSYVLVDASLERLYFVDVGVFSPNKRKETYLRQVDLMAQTFALGEVRGLQTAP